MEVGSIPSSVSDDLRQALGKLKNVGFDAKNPHFKNEYASLPAVLDAVKPVLDEFGFAVSHEVTERDGKVAVSVHLIHEGGVVLTYGPALIPLSKNDPQGWASAVTYARRYTLLAALGVTGDYDDDAEAAVERPKQPSPATKGK